MNHLLFSVDHVRCAVPLATVRIVIRMVQPAPVSDQQRTGLIGMLNFHGQMIPVWSIRSFFGMPDRLPRLTDRIIITDGNGESAALWVDETHVIQEDPVTPASAGTISIEQPLAGGVDLLSDGTVLFADLFRYLGEDTRLVLSRVENTGRSPRIPGDEG